MNDSDNAPEIIGHANIGKLELDRAQIDHSSIGAAKIRHAQVSESQVGLLVTGDAQVDGIEVGFLLARSVRGDVSTAVDGRFVLAGFAVFGLVCAVGSRLLKRK